MAVEDDVEVTISRSVLEDVACSAIYSSPGLGLAQRELLMLAAETVPTILAFAWRQGECGCLVGSAFPELVTRGLEDASSPITDHLGVELYRLGCRFDEMLGVELEGQPGYDRFKEAQAAGARGLVVRVID